MRTSQAQEDAAVAARAAIQSAIKNGLPIDLDGANVVSTIVSWPELLRTYLLTWVFEGRIIGRLF